MTEEKSLQRNGLSNTIVLEDLIMLGFYSSYNQYKNSINPRDYHYRKLKSNSKKNMAYQNAHSNKNMFIIINNLCYLADFH